MKTFSFDVIFASSFRSRTASVNLEINLDRIRYILERITAYDEFVIKREIAEGTRPKENISL